MQLSKPRSVGERAASWVVQSAATLLIALALLRVAYSTEMGLGATDLVPAIVWRWVDALAPHGDGESGENPTAMVLFAICLGVAFAVVRLIVALIVRLRNLSGER
jgi:hypothetical protein